MLISVTQQDIDRGHPGIAERCPIAIAICRQTGRIVSVLPGPLEQCVEAIGRSFPLPPAARTFALRFDAHCKVNPSEFDILGLEEIART